MTSGTPQVTQNGQLLIGAVSAPYIRVSTLTAGTGVMITNGPGTITIGLSGSGIVNTITAGANINLTGTSSNPIINLNTQILQPNGTTNAPSYSFTNYPNSGMWENGSNISFSWQGNEYYRIQYAGNEFIGEVILDSAIDLSYVAPSSWPYTSIGPDCFISVDSSVARTVNLPNSPRSGRMYIIKDRVGSAATNNITITTVGGVVTFDGSTTYKITSNFGSIQLLFNGSSYEVF